jgi:hypothetical protein
MTRRKRNTDGTDEENQERLTTGQEIGIQSLKTVKDSCVNSK